MDGGEPKVGGQIQLLSGTLEVQGKRFEIERGTVTFVGEHSRSREESLEYRPAPPGDAPSADPELVSLISRDRSFGAGALRAAQLR